MYIYVFTFLFYAGSAHYLLPPSPSPISYASAPHHNFWTSAGVRAQTQTHNAHTGRAPNFQLKRTKQQVLLPLTAGGVEMALSKTSYTYIRYAVSIATLMQSISCSNSQK